MAYKAVLAGASGLIGSNLLDLLLNAPEYETIVVLARKTTGIKHIKLSEIILDFDNLADHKSAINGHAIFCCLGTTNNKTPDKAVYKKIDHDYPLQLATTGFENHVEQFHLVSSLGADSHSKVFYTRLKGETEKDIISVGLRSLHIYQPSFLTGKRKEHRLLEKIITAISYIIDPLLVGKLKKYRSIPASTVALALYKQSLPLNQGTFIHPSDNIRQIK